MSYEIKAFNFEEASRQPDTILKWKVGKNITRENFSSFIAQSFMLSRGSGLVQGLMFNDLRTFGYLDENLSLHRLVDSLTQAEIDSIYKRYTQARTDKHRAVERENFTFFLKFMLEVVEKGAKTPSWFEILVRMYKKDTRLAVRNTLKIRSILKQKSLVSPIN